MYSMPVLKVVRLPVQALHMGAWGLVVATSALLPMAAHAAWWQSSSPTFSDYLAQEYVTTAGFEENNATDMHDGRVMRDRAVAVQQGYTVLPLWPSDVRLVRSTAEALAANRARLMGVLGTPAKVQSYPKQVAQAQVAFDCWALHQQAEPNASHNLYQCENRFQRLMAELDPPMAESVPEPVVDARGVRYDILIKDDIMFEWDKAVLTPKAKRQLSVLHAALRQEGQPVKRLALQGFADRSGNAAYNQKLSARRAQAVVRYLEVDPADTVHVNVASYGETNLPIPTADGVREARNRVTNVAIVKEREQQ